MIKELSLTSFKFNATRASFVYHVFIIHYSDSVIDDRIRHARGRVTSFIESKQETKI